MNIFVIIWNECRHKKPKQREITDLKNEEIAFTLPWALAKIKIKGGPVCLYINKSYSIYPEAGGTATLRIKREGGKILVDKSTLTRNQDFSHWNMKDCLPAQFVPQIVSHCLF